MVPIVNTPATFILKLILCVKSCILLSGIFRSSLDIFDVEGKYTGIDGSLIYTFVNFMYIMAVILMVFQQFI
jgi:hypothetical protein